MKEYKTLHVKPSDEESTIERLQYFGWVLEGSNEVYNEAHELVGVNVDSNVKSYGAFMQGWTGKAGKVERKVTYETKKNITHYISLRFSRETASKITRD